MYSGRNSGDLPDINIGEAIMRDTEAFEIGNEELGWIAEMFISSETSWTVDACTDKATSLTSTS
jgi:hypothetical protein